MLCWHFTLAVCWKSHQYRFTPEETFSNKNENKLLALDQTLTSASQSGESKIWTPSCCFESFQKLLQAGKLFILIKYFLSCQAEAASLLTLPQEPAGRSSSQLGSRGPACSAAVLSPKQQQVMRALWGNHFRNHLFICLLPICSPFPPSVVLYYTLFHQHHFPSYLLFLAPCYPWLLTCWSEAKSVWEGKLKSQTLVDCSFLVIHSSLFSKYQEIQ